ncbi:MAG: high-potential iron-sulfur protein [Chitinophagaceae bacterium]|nr:high-potential iron-sulfur protein [Chitinophagaceae bacterium]
MEEKEYSRRQFISQCAGHSAAFMGMMFLLNSCGGNNKPAAKEENTAKPATDPCNDLTGVSAEELDKRKRMAYVDKSQMPGSSCGNCGLYIPWKDQTTCGGCLLFKGPVHAEGHCIQWVAKTT